MGETGAETNDEEEAEEVEYVVDATTQKTYLRGRFLGQGAHAVVYLATDLSSSQKKEYAMKVMNIENSGDKANRIAIHKGRSRDVKLSQVTKEVDIHNLMRHRNVVRLEAHFRNESKFYMILEHCEMNNLAQLLRTYKRFGESETRNFLKQLLAGLQHIHEHGIIHRDLKPANIYVTQDLILKIGDFGLADRIRTKSKGICGTPNYISPEVLNEQGYTTAVDIWATGCITYHMITGRPPFEADNQAATYDLIRTHRYSAIPPAQAGAALRHLVNWMLAFRPEDRPTIPFIFSHTWMKRGQRQGKSGSTSWLKSRRRRNAPKTVPLADLHSEEGTYSSKDRTQISTEGSDRGSSKREFSVWKSILERAKSHTKVISHEDVSNLSVFYHWRNRRHSNGRRKEPLKKVIEEVLRGIPFRSNGSEFAVAEDEPRPVFISKWIDYSNKYGFGYEMTNGTSGVYFGDSTQITLDSDKRYITWCNKGKRTQYPVYMVPNNLQEKVELLNYFVEYMDTNLSSGVVEKQRTEDEIAPLVSYWTRNDKVILFEMEDGTTQVNFFQDHSKYILFENVHRGERNHILLTVDEEKTVRRYNLTRMGRNGCPEDVMSHLIYIHSLL